MSDSAHSKINRASKHIRELADLFNENRPFRYVLETNTVTNQRATMAKKNETVIQEARDIAGDAIHNLRAALDHAYFDIASPFASGDRGVKSVQFPFSVSADKFEAAAKIRLAHKVSPAFFVAIKSLRPYGETGGNKTLYRIHELDALDKHRFPVPTADYKTLRGAEMQSLIPHFPLGGDRTITLSQNSRDVVWFAPVRVGENIGHSVFPTPFMFEKDINIPVDIIFDVGENNAPMPIIPTLNAMVNATKESIRIIREASI